MEVVTKLFILLVIIFLIIVRVHSMYGIVYNIYLV